MTHKRLFIIREENMHCLISQEKKKLILYHVHFYLHLALRNFSPSSLTFCYLWWTTVRKKSDKISEKSLLGELFILKFRKVLFY